MYHKMLVPLDGSYLAEVVMDYTAEIATKLGLEVIFLNVCPLEEEELLPMHQAYIEHAAESLTKRALPNRITAHGKLAMGNPADKILDYAGENGVDLILMATHGRSGVSKIVMGSVAERVWRTSPVPVWLIRGRPFEKIEKKVSDAAIVTLDGSKLSEKALSYAEDLAKQWGNGGLEIILLSVCELPNIPSDYPPDMPLSWEKHVEAETARHQEKIKNYLENIKAKLQEKGLRARVEVLLGQPTPMITTYVQENPAQLIVMATHGRSGVSRWLMGSVAEGVLASANIPVFLIRPSSEEKSAGSESGA